MFLQQFLRTAPYNGEYGHDLRKSTTSTHKSISKSSNVVYTCTRSSTSIVVLRRRQFPAGRGGTVNKPGTTSIRPVLTAALKSPSAVSGSRLERCTRTNLELSYTLINNYKLVGLLQACKSKGGISENYKTLLEI